MDKTSMELVSAVLGVPAFAGALIDTGAKSYALVERYKAAEPRKRQFLDEIQATSELLRRLRDQLSDPTIADTIEPSIPQSLYAWCSRCQTTHHDIEVHFGTTANRELGRKQKLKLAAQEDLFASFERRLSADRNQLVALLESLNLDLSVRNNQGLNRIESNTTFASATLLALEAQSSLRDRASQLSFGTINAQLSQLMRHVDNINAQLSVSMSGPEIPPSRSDAGAPTPEAIQQVVRVVQHATRQYVSRGRLKRDLIVLDCLDIRAVPVKDQRPYARQLTFLRLFIWLLQHAVVSHELWRTITHGEESSIGRHARLSFMWQFSTSLGNLDAALRGPVASDLPFLPDLRYKQWVQYLLDRVGQGLVPVDETSSSKELLSLIDKFWDHFPPPSQGLNIYFVVPIEERLKRARCQCELCKFMKKRDGEIELDERLKSATIARPQIVSDGHQPPQLPRPQISNATVADAGEQGHPTSHLPERLTRVAQRRLIEEKEASSERKAPDASQIDTGSPKKHQRPRTLNSATPDLHQASQEHTGVCVNTPQKRQVVLSSTPTTSTTGPFTATLLSKIVRSECASWGFCNVHDLTAVDQCLKRKEWSGLNCQRTREAGYYCCYIRSDNVERVVIRVFIRRHGGALARWSWQTIDSTGYYCVFIEKPMSDLVFSELKATSKLSQGPPSQRPCSDARPKRP